MGKTGFDTAVTEGTGDVVVPVSVGRGVPAPEGIVIHPATNKKTITHPIRTIFFIISP
jgi:hypothetical protein